LDVLKNTIKEHLRLEPKVTVYMIGGKHAGDVGKLDGIKGRMITYKSASGEVFETLKTYAFVVGNEKPIISLL